MASSNYNCSQSELYTTCRNSWLLCQQYLTDFADYKSKYTAALIAENLALINIVEALDDHEARTAPVKDLRQTLMTQKSDIIASYKQLKGYTAEAYQEDKTTLEAKYSEMGQSYYDKLGRGNWTDVSGLISAMIPFVKTCQVVLSEKGFMPASFLTRLEDIQTNFKAAYKSWKDENDATTNATEAKITANNDLKTRAMAVLTDGQAVFAKNKTLAQKFVWVTLLAAERGVKPSGFVGKVTDAVTGKPIPVASATIDALDKTVVCDKDGRYELSPIATEKCDITFKAEGYQTLVVAGRDVKTGVMGRLNVVLQAVA